MQKPFRTLAFLLFLAALIVYVLGMLVPIMGVDAAQYASIAQQMLEDESYLQIRHRHFDYLDKPPLLFWLAGGAISLFGNTSFAYKLPSVLALFLAIYSTYRYSRLQNNKATSLVAALILMTCQAFFIMANDCRTDNLLIGFSMLAIWKLASYLKDHRSGDLYWGFVAIGLAMLAKGPLGLLFPGFVIGLIMLVRRKSVQISWKWLWAIPIIAIILTPMCIGLYQQHGFKGLEFFFWTQSFGRITGQSRWSNNTDPLFLVHSFLWAFLPFTIVFISSIFTKVRGAIKKQSFTWMDYGNLGGFFLTMIALSLSRYRLPHYIFIVCPIAAILCAQHLAALGDTPYLRRLERIQYFFMGLVLISALALVIFFAGAIPWVHLAILVGILGFCWMVYTRLKRNRRIIFISVAAILFINFTLNTSFYPALLKYQSPSEAAFAILDKKIPSDRVVAFHAYGHALPYYLNKTIDKYDDIKDISQLPTGTCIYTNSKGLSELQQSSGDYRVLQTFDDYHVSVLTFRFLRPATRDSVTTRRYLVSKTR